MPAREREPASPATAGHSQGPGRGGTVSGGEASDILPSGELGALVAGSAATVRYPASLQRAGIGGRVILEVVIDSTGRPEPGTLDVIASAHRLFTDAAR